MKKGTKVLFRIIISIIYIIWGIMSPLSAFKAILALDFNALLSAVVGILMLLAGIMGLIGVKRVKCRVFGIIVFVFALIAAISPIASGAGISWQAIVTALIGWLFIVCV